LFLPVTAARGRPRFGKEEIQRRDFAARPDAGILAQTGVGLGLFIFGDI